jgi:hypothetical protein
MPIHAEKKGAIREFHIYSLSATADPQQNSIFDKVPGHLISFFFAHRSYLSLS